jgi:hypothetical protein
VVAGATAEDGASVDGRNSLYDEDDYSEDEDYEDGDNFGYDEDEDGVSTRSTCADEFRSDIDLRSSDRKLQVGRRR